MAVQRLTAAYRSRPRPSSTPGAKASTVCPYYLDGELSPSVRNARARFLPLRTLLPAHRLGGTLTNAPKQSGTFGLVQFSRSTEATNRGLRPASLKTEQRLRARKAPDPSPVDVSGRPITPKRGRPCSLGAPTRQMAGRRPCELPRKEVIQPQLPLRLPCYDFTPITSPTFDGSLPYGLADRLRVLPAFVV